MNGLLFLKNNLYLEKVFKFILFFSNFLVLCHLGITDHAQNKLGDITYLDFPDVGSTFEEGESMGEIESPKAVSDLYAPANLEVGKFFFKK